MSWSEGGRLDWRLPNIALEQTVGSHALARGCSAQRSPHRGGSQSDESRALRRLIPMARSTRWLSAALLLLLLAAPLAAAQPGKVARVGFLVSQSVTADSLEAFRKGLRELGWSEGQNLTLEIRSPEGNPGRLRALAAELVRLPVDVLVANATPASLAAKQATTVVPIVSVYTLDPVSVGLVASLARPGGNVTGLSTLSLEYAGKMLELLRHAVPNVSRVAVLGDPSNPSHALYWQQLEASARMQRLALVRADVRRADELDAVIAKIGGGQVAQGLLVMHQPLTFIHRNRIVTLAAEHRLPAVYGSREAVDDGGLIAFGPSMRVIYRRAATFVDRILKGAKPADLPVEQPTEFQLVVNMRTARALGLTIPSQILARADEIIQ
jgi:putative tryptophan/tyrosine transport system substrate-binding protein